MKLLIAVMLLVSGVAHADGMLDGTKARLADQVKALKAGDAKAFAATFRDDDTYAMLPEVALEGSGKAEIEKVVAKWLPAIQGATFDKQASGESTIGGWFFVQITVGKQRFRLTGVTASGHLNDHTKPDQVKVVAVAISEAVEDSVALKAKLPKLPKLAHEESWTSSYFTPEGMLEVAWEETMFSGIWVGSAPSEVNTSKKLKPFKGMKIKTLQQFGLSDSDDENHTHDLFITVAHVTVNGIPFRALIAGTPGLAGSDPPTMLCAHFMVSLK